MKLNEPQLRPTRLMRSRTSNLRSLLPRHLDRTKYSYNNRDELLTQTTGGVTTTSYYGANGNLTGDSTGTGYTYDLRNKMIQAAVNAVTVKYTYDHDGLRVVRQIVGGDRETYLPDLQNPTGYSQTIEITRNGSLAQSFVIGRNIIAQADGSTMRYLLSDQLGSTRALLDATGQPITGQLLAYDAFGSVISGQSSILTQVQFAQQLVDSITKLSFNRARWYDLAGRWTQSDPRLCPIGDTVNNNRDLYSGANPIGLHDPSGRAVYFVERKLSSSWGPLLWPSSIGHAYLLFTTIGDPGCADPFAANQVVLDTFSFHPSKWDYDDCLQSPSRVWEYHPDDTMPIAPFYRAFLVTANPVQQKSILDYVNGWIRSNPVGYEFGAPTVDPSDPSNQISVAHVDSPADGISYSVGDQNCVWWVTIMLKQSGITVPAGVYSEIADYNMGVGGGPQVVWGLRSADEVDKVAEDGYRNLNTLNNIIDGVAWGAAILGIV